MRFHLVYHGDLPASANKSKPADVLRIRRELSPQMEALWDTHNGLRTLRGTSVRQITSTTFGIGGPALTPRQMMAMFPEHFEDLLPPIEVKGRKYTPLVRESLSLSCELDILFLRPQDPGKLISQGGDIDGRIKTLLDALRMPQKGEDAELPPEDHLFCLMQDDALVSRLDIDTDRLLVPLTGNKHEVHIVIEVRLNVLQVSAHNMCLL